MVLDEEGSYVDDAKVYFILTGTYAVESLMFNMGNKLDEMDEND